MRKRVARMAVPAERDLAAVWARTTGTLALAGGGAARFRANVARLRHKLESAADEVAREQVAYEALAETLGYSRNAGPMQELARAVPLRALTPHLSAGERSLLSEEGRSPHPSPLP